MISKTAVGVAASFAAAALVGAAEARVELEIPRVEMRLLDGGLMTEDGGERLAGVEIRVGAGWKTYWRRPGDSGLAPRFDFSRSANVAEVTVLWPAPSISHDGYGWVIGYAGEVVFPLVVAPRDPDRPIQLVLDLDYAICSEICVPLDASDARALGEEAPDRPPIDFYRDMVPEALPEGDRERGVQDVRRVTADDHEVLELVVKLEPGSADPKLIVEGPDSWQVGVAELSHRSEDGTATFRVSGNEEWPSGVGVVVTGLLPRSPFEQPVLIP